MTNKQFAALIRKGMAYKQVARENHRSFISLVGWRQIEVCALGAAALAMYNGSTWRTYWFFMRHFKYGSLTHLYKKLGQLTGATSEQLQFVNASHAAGWRRAEDICRHLEAKDD